MTRSRRSYQLGTQIKAEVSRLLHDFLQKDQYGLLTVLDVDMNDDISIATVWISVYDSEVGPATIQKALNLQARKIQKELNKLLAIKKVPRINFRIDNSSEYVNNIDRIFKEIDDAKNK